MHVKGEIPDKADMAALIEEGRYTNEQMARKLGLTLAKFRYWKNEYGLTEKRGEVIKWTAAHPELKPVYGSLDRNTKKGYYTDLRQYCLWCGKEPKELWKEKKETAQERLIQFREYLEEQGMSSNTISVYVSAIRRFFEYQDIVFKGKFISNGRAAVPKEENEKVLIEPHMLQNILELSTPMERAMYMIQFQSGLSSNELCSLRLRHIGTVDSNGVITFNKKNGVIKIRRVREKTRERFITFIGHDGIAYLNKWLELRQSGNALKDREISKGAIIRSENDFLFVTYSRRYGTWGPISTDGYARGLLIKIRQLGWIKDENLRGQGRLSIYRPHALRMSFSEILRGNKVKVRWDYVEHWLGHKLSKTHRAYANFDEDEMQKEYKRGEPFLSLTPIEAIVSNDQYLELKTENELLKQRIEETSRSLLALGATIAKLQTQKSVQQKQKPVIAQPDEWILSD